MRVWVLCCALATAGCYEPIDFSAHPCPCAAGFVCEPSLDRCVPIGTDAGVPHDVGTDAALARDAGDAGADASHDAAVVDAHACFVATRSNPCDGLLDGVSPLTPRVETCGDCLVIAEEFGRGDADICRPHLYIRCNDPEGEVAADVAAARCAAMRPLDAGVAPTLLQIDGLAENSCVAGESDAGICGAFAGWQPVGGLTFWAGGRRASGSRTWTWPDGTPFWNGGALQDDAGVAVGGRYTNWHEWAPADGSGDCLVVKGQWANDVCTCPTMAPECTASYVCELDTNLLP